MKIKKRYTAEQVRYALAGLNEISDEEEEILSDALAVLDKELVDKIASEVYFISASLIKAVCLPLDTVQLKGKKAIIFISNELLKQGEAGIKQDLLHEVAHHILKHKCLFDFDEAKMRQEVLRQEKEADNLVKKWIAK